MKWITRDFVVATLLFLSPFILYFPVTLGQQIFFIGDVQLQLYPMRAALARAFAEGRLPLWEPGIAMGFPLFAEGQIGALRPIYQILYRVLPIHLALGYELLLHLGWMMAGLYCFARALRHHVASAILLAIILPTSAYLTDSLMSLGIVVTSAYLPWMLWLVEKIFSESRVRWRGIWFALLALAMFVQFIGHPYLLLLDIGIVTAYSATWYWHHLKKTWVRWWQPVVVVVIAIAIGLGLSALQILPTMELSSLSTRAGGVSYEDFTVYSVAPKHLLLIFAPYAWGSPYDLPGGVGGYVGMIPLVLALAAPFVQRNRRTWFWGLFALAALILALGKYSPIYPLLYYVPGFNSLRIAGHFLWVYSFAVGMLAMIALDRLLEIAPIRHGNTQKHTEQENFSAKFRVFPWQKYGVAKLLALAFALVIAAEIILTYQVPMRDWLAFWNWLPLTLALVSVGVVWGAWRRKFLQAYIAAIVIGVTIFDVIAFDAVYIQSKNSLVPATDFVRAPQALPVLQTQPGMSRTLTIGAMVPPFATAQESLFPDLGTLYGLASVKGTTGLVLRRSRNYTDNLSAGMLNLTSARYLLVPIFPANESGQAISQPSDKFAIRLSAEKMDLPAMSTSAIEIDSYLELSPDLADGTEVAWLTFFFDDGTKMVMPLRAGFETADWSVEREAARRMPPIATAFPAYWHATNQSFRGHVYRARFDLSNNAHRNLVGIALDSNMPSNKLHIDHIRALDDKNESVLLDYALGASNHSTIFHSDRVVVIENHDALPRAFIVHAAQIVDDAGALTRLRDYAFDPRSTLLLADGTAMDQDSPEQDPDERVEITRYQPEHVELRAHVQHPGYLVLADTWYPSWSARVDGKAVPVHRADYVFRAVRLDAGEHIVEFDYRPTSVYNGAAISLSTLIVLMIGVAVWLVRN